MGFWQNVEEECKYQGISRKELAATAHFSVNTISTGLKRNGMPEADLALRISKALDIPLEKLLSEEDTAVSAVGISEQKEKLELLSRYLPVIEKLERMSPATMKAVLTIIDNVGCKKN